MKYAIVQNSIIQTTGTLQELFPNVSISTLGVEEDFLTENFAVKIVDWLDFIPETETLKVVEPYILENKVYSVQIAQKSPQELVDYEAQLLAAKETEVRLQRNQLLKDSDWTQIADAPVDKTAWATYRQALRDITQQTGFPFNTVFPELPVG